MNSRDVAAAARVSQSTVSRVINGSPQVRPETRVRVERAMAALGYIPNAAARSLITRRTRMLGLVVSNITNGFYPEIIDAITSCALGEGYTVLVGSAGERPDSQATYLRLMAEQRVDGLILTSTLFRDGRDIAALARGGLPIVLANRVRDDLPLDGVSLDNDRAGSLAALHLVEHGRRAIAYVGGQEETATDLGRRAGFGRALRDAGLVPVEVDGPPGAFTREHGYQATRRLLARAPADRPDGIVAGDDTVALGVLDALAEAGVRVPDDVGVVGFDDIPAASLRSIWLTTVSTAAREMGIRAVALLLDRLSGRAGQPRREVIAPHLVVRGTCGAHRSTPDAVPADADEPADAMPADAMLADADEPATTQPHPVKPSGARSRARRRARQPASAMPAHGGPS